MNLSLESSECYITYIFRFIDRNSELDTRTPGPQDTWTWDTETDIATRKPGLSWWSVTTGIFIPDSLTALMATLTWGRACLVSSVVDKHGDKF